MGSPQQTAAKPSAKEGQKIGKQSQQGQPRDDDHTNSARAGENPNRPDDGSEKDQ